jgi:hypothetical protein
MIGDSRRGRERGGLNDFGHAQLSITFGDPPRRRASDPAKNSPSSAGPMTVCLVRALIIPDCSPNEYSGDPAARHRFLQAVVFFHIETNSQRRDYQTSVSQTEGLATNLIVTN